jgi:hypothetical protein
MARRRGRKRRGRRQKSVSIALIVPPLGLAADQISKKGVTYSAAGGILAGMTGYDPTQQTFNADWAKPFWMGMVAAIVAHKVAEKVGVNKQVRKATMGYLSI